MKKFLILGNIMAAKYKSVFPLIKDKCIWTGANDDMVRHFYSGTNIDVQASTLWYTNIESAFRHKKIELKTMEENITNNIEYKKYDNYDAIEVGDYRKMPIDYDDWMGLSITVFHKFDKDVLEYKQVVENAKVEGKAKFTRVIVRWKR